MQASNQAYAFRYERWILTQPGRFFSGKMRYEVIKHKSRQTDAMHAYLNGKGEIPFIHEGKVALVRQVKAHRQTLNLRAAVSQR